MKQTHVKCTWKAMSHQVMSAIEYYTTESGVNDSTEMLICVLCHTEVVPVP